MIKADVSQLQKSLEEAKKLIKARLENMVKEFVYESSVKFIDNTPYGDAVANERYYNMESRLEYLSPVQGTAKAGWEVGFNESNSNPFPSPASSEEALDVKQKIAAKVKTYQLGDTVYLTNAVPYVANTGWTLPNFGSLEGGYSAQAPQGIMKPSTTEVLSLYNSDLQRLYNRHGL